VGKSLSVVNSEGVYELLDDESGKLLEEEEKVPVIEIGELESKRR